MYNHRNLRPTFKAFIVRSLGVCHTHRIIYPWLHFIVLSKQ